MTSPARAPRPTPRRQPVAERPSRPDLRVVGPATRRSRTGFVVVVAAAAVFAALFVAAASHSMVVTGQVHLDEVGRQVRAEQELLAKEQARLADDQSPARITQEAERLGMVPATEQNWVSPGAGGATVVTGTAPPTTAAPEADGSSSTDGTSSSSDPASTDGSTATADELAAGTDTGVATDR